MIRRVRTRSDPGNQEENSRGRFPKNREGRQIAFRHFHRDVLRGIPHFSMHIIRSTLGDHILDETDLPPGTASLVIGHEIAGDRRNDEA